MKKIETSETRILSKKSRKTSFFENDYSIQKKNDENELSNDRNIIEIHLIAVVSFNILSRQKDVKIFVVFMKDLKIQLKKQDSNKMIDSRSMMSSEYHDFLNVFFKKKANILSSHKKHDYRIELEKDHKSNHEYVSLYNLSEKELLLIKKYLKEHVNKDFIESSIASYASSILFAKNSDDKFRFCVDYKKLNVIIKKNRYSIFLIAKTIARLSKTK